MRRALDRRQFADRDFQLWAYVVSHQRLMLRSPKSEEHPLNIDLHFGAVEYVDLPTTLRGLTLTSPRAEEVERLRRKLGSRVEPGHIYVVESAGHRRSVVAWSLYVEENDLGFMETPIWTAPEHVAQ
jgi:hypothetical protein